MLRYGGLLYTCCSQPLPKTKIRRMVSHYMNSQNPNNDDCCPCPCHTHTYIYKEIEKHAWPSILNRRGRYYYNNFSQHTIDAEIQLGFARAYFSNGHIEHKVECQNCSSYKKQEHLRGEVISLIWLVKLNMLPVSTRGIEKRENHTTLRS